MKNLLLVFAIVAPLASAMSPNAFQIDARNIHGIERGGPSAVAGIGDWWLTNSQLCVAVSGLQHDAGIVAGGGNLVDIAQCGQRNDQWLNTNILAGMAKDDALQAQAIEARNDDNRAAIVVTGEKDGIRQTVTYALQSGSDRLHMTIALQRVGDGPRLGMSAVLTLHPGGSLVPFSAGAPEARGFRLNPVNNNSILEMLRAMTAADTAYLLGNTLQSPAISYRMKLLSATLRDRKHRLHDLPIFQLAVSDYVMQGWMTRPVGFGSGAPGLLTFSQMPLMDLREGELLTATFEITVSGTEDVAGFERPQSAHRQLQGVTRPGAVLAIYDGDGGALTQTRADSSGAFKVSVPAAPAYEIDITTPTGGLVTRRIAEREADEKLQLALPEPGELQLPRGEIMQLTFIGVDDTPNPVFRGERALLRDGDVLAAGSLRSNSVVLTASEDDPEAVLLAAGRYRVLASRGLDFAVTEAVVSIEPGQRNQLDIAPPLRQVLHTGHVAADFHVHSAISFDTTAPRRHQLKRYFANGGEVLVFTEHNRIAAVDDAGDLALQIINGIEYTGTARTRRVPTTIGHSNAFPVTHDPLAHRGGMPRVEDSRLREVIGRTRSRWPGSLVQLNHPRSPHPNDADLAFFSHLSQGQNFDPAKPLPQDGNALLLEPGEDGTRDIDFDLIEVLNGSEIEVYAQVRRDWLALLAAGYRKVATANSDSHGWRTPLGVPVNRVALDDNNLPVDEADLVNAIQAGRLYGSSGPSLGVALLADNDRFAPGDTCRCTQATLEVSIAAADWVNVDTLNVYTRDGKRVSVALKDVDTQRVEIVFAVDDFVVVELTGAPSDTYEALYPGYTPIAFSNPVYVDADGDGAWTPGR